MESEDVDLVVVGAGISGIAAARFYLEIHPESAVVILEQDTCPGGVWSSRRSYEAFWTQWTVGAAQWSDMPMDRPPEDDVYYGFFKAKHTTEYLERYLDHHHFGGRTLRNRILFNFKVRSIKKRDTDTSWTIAGDKAIFRAAKVIAASGMSSTPNMPALPGKANFEAPIIHQKGFGQSSVLSSSQFGKVTVIGGGKSAADMVYACVKAGKTVSWIIRPSGTGPGYLISPKGKGPYKNAFELGSTRFLNTLSPSINCPDTWWTRFLNRTNLGRHLVMAAWNGADAETLKYADFDGRQDALESFQNLKPKAPLFWQNSNPGLLNHADFWETIASNVRVYLDDILELDKGLIRLEGGDEISTDVLLCGTGWHASFPFLESKELVRLGLPHIPSDEPVEQSALWERLYKQADAEVVRSLPILANHPEHPHKPLQYTPFRLYSGIAPLHDSSIAFVGYMDFTDYFKGVECQAIWATAFLDGKIAIPPLEAAQAEIARFIAWSKRRYLSNGERGTFIPFESNFYLDRLLQQVGLVSHIKGWFAKWFVPGTTRDLAGLKDEYIAKYGMQ